MVSRIIFGIFLGIAFTHIAETQFTVPGKCPKHSPEPECPPEPDDECNNDAKCAELYPGQGLKCCLKGCNKECVRPILPLPLTVFSATWSRDGYDYKYFCNREASGNTSGYTFWKLGSHERRRRRSNHRRS